MSNLIGLNDQDDPTPSIISEDSMELDEARKVLITCAIVAVASNPDVARKMTDRERGQIRKGILSAPLNVLYDRLEAISQQNPGCLAEALKRSGYKLTVDGDGGITIDPEADSEGFGLIGKPVDWDEYMKNMENEP